MKEDNTYKIMTIRFRKVEDAALIKKMEDAVAAGGSKREVLHDLFYLAPKLPTDTCSISEVEKLLMMYRVPRVTRENIINTLKKQCLV
jgi:hypothetical protein